jgi:hypothetical protein
MVRMRLGGLEAVRRALPDYPERPLNRLEN